MQFTLQDLEKRFVSGNSVPVERAHITREEFVALCASLRPKHVLEQFGELSGGVMSVNPLDQGLNAKLR